MNTTPVFEMLREATPTISIGMLTADLLSLGSEISLLEQTDAKMVHFDVADGVFCPMMTIGPPVVKAVKTPLLKDVHLLIQDPLEKIGDFVSAGADIVTVHVESCVMARSILREIGKMKNANDPDRGIVRGIALNPETPVQIIGPLLDEVEMVMLLAVQPGVTSQFHDATPGRLAKAREMIAKSGKDILLTVDGGIKRDNIADVAKMGADIVVTGSAVFDGKDPIGNARHMLSMVRVGG